ncbi:hypothetical protein PMZ80_005528 [Knufia obscura]|uniref:Uncharacterized protein n=1 Tax=Knufia obscura TaxID=1635080 RepID=A0ABR0RLU5_9EURO|nr:hypothetical protein PMZ80_005528 [Knufia obscura]
MSNGTETAIGEDAHSGCPMTRSEMQEMISAWPLCCSLKWPADMLADKGNESPVQSVYANNVLRYGITCTLAHLYHKSGYTITVKPSALVMVGSDNARKRKSCDDDIRSMFKVLLDTRREIDTALIQASASVSSRIGPVHIHNKPTHDTPTSDLSPKTLVRTSADLAGKIKEKIICVVEERPIENRDESVMVQEIHSADDEDFKNYIQEYRKLIRW